MTTNEVPRQTAPANGHGFAAQRAYGRAVRAQAEMHGCAVHELSIGLVSEIRASIAREYADDPYLGNLDDVISVTRPDVAPAPNIEYDRSMTKNELPEYDMSHALGYSFYVTNGAYALDADQISLDTPGSYASLADTRTAALAYLAALRMAHWGVLNEGSLVGQTRSAFEGDSCILVDPSGRAFDLWIDVAGL